MYQPKFQELTFENFHLPFGGKLDSNNRWVKLSDTIPWHVAVKFLTIPEVGSGFQQMVDITALGYPVFRNPEIPILHLQSKNATASTHRETRSGAPNRP
jgi:hypothetical protein